MIDDQAAATRPSSAVEDFEQTIYPSTAYLYTHPDRLATLARLHGLDPAPVERCRVLEVGCGTGDNIIPMAAQYPSSQFIGVDLSPTQIGIARGTAQRLGLTNLTLIVGDFAEMGEQQLGKLDYVIAHGFYSWVPPHVQRHLFAVCQNLLTDDGVAYVSYNAQPGWRTYGLSRDIMRFRTRHMGDSPQRAEAGRSIIESIAEHAVGVGTEGIWGQVMDSYSHMMSLQAHHLRGQPDVIVLHDELSQYNEPMYFSDFMDRAAVYGLQYLTDAGVNDNFEAHLPAEVRAELEAVARDIVEFEQYVDFYANRVFRRTLLCRADRAVRRPPEGAAMNSLLIASSMREIEPDDSAFSDAGPDAARFVTSNGLECITADPLLKAAFRALIHAFPASLSLDNVTSATRTALANDAPHSTTAGGWPTFEDDRNGLADELLQSYLLGSGIELRTTPVPCVGVVSDRPLASDLARLQAGLGNTSLINQRHERIAVDDGTRILVTLLDGTRDLAAVNDAWQEISASSPERVWSTVATLARHALLVA